MENYQIFHLSHTDLDGYGCQMITNFYFDNVKFYNSNYGKEINERFNEILNDVEKCDQEKNVILITDLNLTKEQCENFENLVLNAPKDIKLMLLDHHKSGLECFWAYKWYFLDDSRCATKITYDFFSSLYGENEELALLTNVVNAVDIWLDKDEYFELGKVCLGLVANSKEINRVVFAKENSMYMFHLLKLAQNYFLKADPHIALDDALHQIKKDFFMQNRQNDTLSNLVSTYMVELLSKHKNEMSVTFNSYKGILTYNIGNVSVIGNEFLVKNPDFDFFMDVTSRKTVSFRANGKVDVSAIAKKVANGGGHPNASGGALSGFRDSFLYQKVISQVQNIFNQKEEL